MRNVVFSIIIILSPILLASQNAVADFLPCEKMSSAVDSSIHASHQMASSEMASSEMASQVSDSHLNCSCDHGDCHISHQINTGTLFNESLVDNIYSSTELNKRFTPQLISSIYPPPFRPPIA